MAEQKSNLYKMLLKLSGFIFTLEILDSEIIEIKLVLLPWSWSWLTSWLLLHPWNDTSCSLICVNENSF